MSATKQDYAIHVKAAQYISSEKNVRIPLTADYLLVRSVLRLTIIVGPKPLLSYHDKESTRRG